MGVERLNFNSEQEPFLKQEEVAQQEKEPAFEPICGGCEKPLYYVGLNYRNQRIWSCKNKSCGREGAGVVGVDDKDNETPPFSKQSGKKEKV